MGASTGAWPSGAHWHGGAADEFRETTFIDQIGSIDHIHPMRFALVPLRAVIKLLQTRMRNHGLRTATAYPVRFSDILERAS